MGSAGYVRCEEGMEGRVIPDNIVGFGGVEGRVIPDNITGFGVAVGKGVVQPFPKEWRAE